MIPVDARGEVKVTVVQPQPSGWQPQVGGNDKAPPLVPR